MREADAAALAAIYAPYVRETAITFEYEAPDAAEFAARIRATASRYPYLVAERGGRPVGYAYAGPFKERAAYDWAVETSLYVARGLERTGVGGALHAVLERELRERGFRTMYACIAVPPGASDEFLTWNSVRFHEHLGYRLVGTFRACGCKFGRWYDMVWMELPLVCPDGAAPDPAVVSAPPAFCPPGSQAPEPDGAPTAAPTASARAMAPGTLTTPPRASRSDSIQADAGEVPPASSRPVLAVPGPVPPGAPRPPRFISSL